jgi:hypothetical protein
VCGVEVSVCTVHCCCCTGGLGAKIRNWKAGVYSNLCLQSAKLQNCANVSMFRCVVDDVVQSGVVVCFILFTRGPYRLPQFVGVLG